MRKQFAIPEINVCELSPSDAIMASGNGALGNAVSGVNTGYSFDAGDDISQVYNLWKKKDDWV